MFLHFSGVLGASGTCCKTPPKYGFHAPAGQTLQREIFKFYEKDIHTPCRELAFYGGIGVRRTGYPQVASKEFQGTSTRKIGSENEMLNLISTLEGRWPMAYLIFHNVHMEHTWPMA